MFLQTWKERCDALALCSTVNVLFANPCIAGSFLSVWSQLKSFLRMVFLDHSKVNAPPFTGFSSKHSPLFEINRLLFFPQFIHLSYISLWHKFYETMDRSSTGLYVQLLTNIYKLNSKILQSKFTYKLHLNLMAGLFHFLKPRI